MSATDPPLRADARRNRDAILAAAVRRFAAEGPEAGLDGIARDAGVGNATLYRHFPTRLVLVEAAYRAELDDVCDAAAALLAEHDGAAALRAWMERFLGYMTVKLGMAHLVRAAVAGGPPTHSRERLVAAAGTVLEAAAAAGAIAPGADPDDVCMALAGIAWVASGPGRDGQAGRLLDLLLSGLRGSERSPS